ncbi:YibE/F family protein [Oceanirhabdus sp. W0125-5]|uniref:YibE/F family protein n=1 Tax=Oceanirhabdus sp. W0125-5 TaxID=2999116 RepID=UPI0022F31046|nr:YibE/F family protein [Oceanirhabdus sp. W0125-5]WBW99173.1 YibE/F family protein [Oceanirhabdus sp. W0125-5]
MKKKKILEVCLVIIILILGLSFFTSLNSKLPEVDNKSMEDTYNLAKAKVLKIHYDDLDVKEKPDGYEKYLRKQEMDIEILDGIHKGEKFKIRNTIQIIEVYYIVVKEGEKIIVNMTEDQYGEVTSIHIYERARENYAYLLIGLFVISILLVGRLKGINAIVSLVITGIVIIKGLLPSILKGYNPVIMTLISCGIIISCSLILLIGINRKSITAALSTLGGVTIAGVIAMIVGKSAYVTGLAGEHAQTIAFTYKDLNLDFRGILFSGIIIGALGAVMDVCISITSSLYEMMDIKSDITPKQLMKSGMNIGKDIIGTMSNTLILAYVGGAIQLILLLMVLNTSYTQIINLDMMMSEIVTALAGSIGLVWSVPLTILLVILFREKK